MKIHLRYYYLGKLSNMRVIPAGTYDESDPALFGLAGYLVKSGHATIVPETEAPTEVLAADLPEAEAAPTEIEIVEEPKAGLPMPVKRGRRPRQ